MPNLLLEEIGCEELPSSAVYGRAGSCPTLSADTSAPSPTSSFWARDGTRGARARPVGGNRTGMDPGASGTRRRKGGRGLRPEARIPGAGVEREGAWGWEKPAEPSDGLPAKVDAIVDGLQFGKPWSGRPSRGRLTGCWRCSTRTAWWGRRRSAIASSAAQSRSSPPPPTRSAHLRPSLEARRATIVEGLDALGSWRDRSRRRRGEEVNLDGMAVRARGALRRALPPVARAGGRDGDAVASAPTSRSRRRVSPSSRTAAIPKSSHRQRACAARPSSTMPCSPSSATPLSASTLWPAAERRSSRARGASRTRPSGWSGWWAGWAVTTSRSPPPGWRGRPGLELVREFPELEGTSARSTRGSPGSRSPCASRSTSSISPMRRMRRCRSPRRGAYSPLRTSSIR